MYMYVYVCIKSLTVVNITSTYIDFAKMIFYLSTLFSKGHELIYVTYNFFIQGTKISCKTHQTHENYLVWLST